MSSFASARLSSPGREIKAFLDSTLEWQRKGGVVKARLRFTFLALGWLIGCAHSAVKPRRAKPSEVRVTTNPVEVKRCAFVGTVLAGEVSPQTSTRIPNSVADLADLRKKASDAGGDTVLAIVDGRGDEVVSGDVYLCRK